MEQKNKFYLLVDSNFAIENVPSVEYFILIITKTFPEYKWELIYTENIPLDGNVYVCLEASIRSFYQEMIVNKKFKTKDILNDHIMNDENRMYAVSFNYNVELIKLDLEVKRSAFSFLKDVVGPSINKLLKIGVVKDNVTEEKNEEKYEESLLEYEDAKKAEISGTGNSDVRDEIPDNNLSVPTEEEISEVIFLIDDVVSQLASSSSYKSDKSLDSFDGIHLYSSSNPGKFITLALTARKNYPNRMLISELFVILKASFMLGTDSIKFYMRKSATHE